MADQVTITVDGRELQVPAGEWLIKACQDRGIYIPRFCWHPRMKPVGMCRMCLVEVEGPRGAALTTSCTMTVADGMVVHTESDTVKKAQEGVLEFLLINHPLDCPVCDRGGECPLQDQTMAYGPGESRFVEEKRHFEKPIEISELVMLDRERCILCARCTRFSDEISGDPLIEFKERGYGTQVLTFPDEPFRSYFSGNTVQICPVGALTATPYRFRARPWDLEAVESTCPHCSVGCRISVQSSQNEVLRFLGIDNDATNQGWLCDKGRFGFQYLSSPERLEKPLIRTEGGGHREAAWGEALDLIAGRLREIIDEHGGSAVAGLGGARGTNEDAYTWVKFLRSVVGTNHVDAQFGDGLDPQFLAGTLDRATIPDLERATTVLVWAPDLKEELPVLYLRVRRAAQELGANLVVVHPRRTGLDDRATMKFTYRPGEGPSVLRRLAAGDGDFAEARRLLEAGPTVAIVGRPGLAEDPGLPEAVAAFVRTLPRSAVMPVARRSNLYGALDMGAAPTLLPGRVSASNEDGRAALAAEWGELPVDPGRDASGIIPGIEAGEIRALLLNGADPLSDFPDGMAAQRALRRAELLVAVDLFLTPSAKYAHVVLPALGFAEKEGTVTNLEGRVQKVNRLVPGPGQARRDLEIFDDLARRMGGSLEAGSAAVVAKEIARVAPAYRGIGWDQLEFGPGREGIVVPGPDGAQPLEYVPVDGKVPARRSETVLHLARTLYDAGTAVTHGASIRKLIGVARAHLHPDDASRLGVSSGNRVRVTTASGSADLTVEVDGSLRPGVVYVPFNQEWASPVGNDLEARVTRVEEPL